MILDGNPLWVIYLQRNLCTYLRPTNKNRPQIHEFFFQEHKLKCEVSLFVTSQTERHGSDPSITQTYLAKIMCTPDMSEEPAYRQEEIVLKHMVQGQKLPCYSNFTFFILDKVKNLLMKDILNLPWAEAPPIFQLSLSSFALLCC